METGIDEAAGNTMYDIDGNLDLNLSVNNPFLEDSEEAWDAGAVRAAEKLATLQQLRLYIKYLQSLERRHLVAFAICPEEDSCAKLEHKEVAFNCKESWVSLQKFVDCILTSSWGSEITGTPLSTPLSVELEADMAILDLQEQLDALHQC